MKVIVSIFTLAVFLVSFGSHSKNIGHEKLEQFDLRYYHPEVYGLRDLYFQIRVSDLVQNLSKNMALGKIDDVFVEVYWLYPKEYRLRVKGLPGGFKELRASIKNSIKPMLNYVVPKSIVSSLRSYEITGKKEGSFVIVKGKERTQKVPLSSVEFKINSSGELKEKTLTTPQGIAKTEFEYSKRKWSHNKWVVSKMLNKSVMGNIKNETKLNFSYENISGYGLPIKISMNTSVSPYSKEKEKSKNVQTQNREFSFSKYRVNSGVAKKLILKGK